MTDAMKKSIMKESPQSIVPKSEQFNLLDVDSTELARQMTLIDWEYFSTIKHYEFLNQGWTKAATSKQSSLNILEMIEYSNRVPLFLFKNNTRLCIGLRVKLFL